MKYFEDLEVGETMRFGRYEVTRGEILDYARQFDPQPFHVDEEAARASLFGGLIASGWHTGAMMMRMVADHMGPAVATAGAMGFDDLKWLQPVRPGDVLSVESIVRECTAVDEFQILLTREGLHDEITVLIEMKPGRADHWTALQSRLIKDLPDAHEGLRFNVILAEPDSLPRFELKAKRLVDKRPAAIYT